MFLVNAAMEKISIGTAALIVVLGMAVVFFGLILLMYVTKIAGAIISRKKSAEPAAAPAAAPAAPAVKTAPAPGTAGKIALHDVPDKTAAMLMAIVARQDRQAAQPAPVHLHPRDQGLTPLLHRDAHGSCAFPFLRHFVHYAHS